MPKIHLPNGGLKKKRKRKVGLWDSIHRERGDFVRVRVWERESSREGKETVWGKVRKREGKHERGQGMRKLKKLPFKNIFSRFLQGRAPPYPCLSAPLTQGYSQANDPDNKRLWTCQVLVQPFRFETTMCDGIDDIYMYALVYNLNRWDMFDQSHFDFWHNIGFPSWIRRFYFILFYFFFSHCVCHC
jgi:hypothetical protein